MSKQNVFFQVYEKGRSLKLKVESLFEEDEPEPGTESQFAVLRVKVHRAEGLPNLTRGLLSHFKKRYAVEEGDFIDPCVHVFFAGLKGCTTRKSKQRVPCGDEQIVFTTKFPLPLGPIVVQVRDDDFMVNNDIGTVAIPLKRYPARMIMVVDGRRDRDRRRKCLFKGVCSGRAHITCAGGNALVNNVFFTLATEVDLGNDRLRCGVFLFGCVHDASIIDRTLSEMKDIRFSLQMGLKGRETVDGELDDNNATPFISPLPMDKRYVYAPYEDTKPCMWLKGIWPDDRKRMFVSNILWKMGHKLKECLTRIQKPSSTVHPEDESSNNNYLLDLENIAMKYDESNADLINYSNFRRCYLKVLIEYCNMYLSKTKLDHERAGIFLSDMEDIVRVCDTARKASSKNYAGRCLGQTQVPALQNEVSN
ncbi:otoferlin [Caerostris extrusa]|uniref:Otoferlin n=1 Tax=Caerostris extrusa TaxID=172846 RepID=A0AAV4M6B2_CAEEX|nr:otoferlin [Caerostris extrusa]